MTVQPPEGADDVGLIEGDSTSSAYSKKGKLKAAAYDVEMERLQEQLVLLQYWIQTQGLKVLVIFEGRGSAGKGGVIKRITERTSPRTVRVVALPKPTERQRTQWYFQRYVEHLPAAGEMVLFDRSWYNRSNVEWVMDYCSQEEHQEFLRSCPEFERMLVRSGITVIKYWFSVSFEEQRKRFEARNAEPLKRWKLTDMDLAEHELYVKLLDGEGHHVPVHRHQAGALVRRPLRRQEGRAAQLHQPPAWASSTTSTSRRTWSSCR